MISKAQAADLLRRVPKDQDRLKEIVTEAAAEAGIECSWDGYRYRIPARSYHTKRDRSPFELCGEVTAFGVMVARPGSGGDVFALPTAVMLILKGLTAAPHREEQAEYDRALCNFVEHRLGLSIDDLDQTFYGVYLPGSSPKACEVGTSVQNIARVLGAAPGSGIFVAEVKALSTHRAAQELIDLPGDAWKRYIVDAFGEVKAA